MKMDTNQDSELPKLIEESRRSGAFFCISETNKERDKGCIASASPYDWTMFTVNGAYEINGSHDRIRAMAAKGFKREGDKNMHVHGRHLPKKVEKACIVPSVDFHKAMAQFFYQTTATDNPVKEVVAYDPELQFEVRKETDHQDGWIRGGFLWLRKVPKIVKSVDYSKEQLKSKDALISGGNTLLGQISYTAVRSVRHPDCEPLRGRYDRKAAITHAFVGDAGLVDLVYTALRREPQKAPYFFEGVFPKMEAEDFQLVRNGRMVIGRKDMIDTILKKGECHEALARKAMDYGKKGE